MKLVKVPGPVTVECEYQFPRVATTNCHKFGGSRQQFWRPEVQVQGVGRDNSFRRLRENLFHVSVPAPGESWSSLPCGNLMRISVFICTRYKASLLCLCQISSFFVFRDISHWM